MTAVHEGLGVGLALTATGLGFRHGCDWDHFAAISDIAAAQDTPRRAFGYATCYFAGHGAIVGVLGALAIVAGEHVPRSVDHVMERFVGATLCLLGIYVLASLARNGRNFRMRSRWMLIFIAVRRVGHKLRRRPAEAVTAGIPASSPPRAISGQHDHEHGHVAGSHRHLGDNITLPEDGFWAYGPVTSVAVGALHGIGAETPTQVLLLAAAATAGGAAPGIALLGAFLLGLFASNTIVGLTVALGFLGASRNFAVYAIISVFTGLAGMTVGALLLIGQSRALPALFGG